jgi:hypothetical protein
LRFLTVVKAEKVDIDARAAEIEARGEAITVTEEKEIQQKELVKGEGEIKEE